MFKSKRETGHLLAKLLKESALGDGLTLHDLSRTVVAVIDEGGLPVAGEIAKELHVPMVVLGSEKIPSIDLGGKDLGAVASNGLLITDSTIDFPRLQYSYVPVAARALSRKARAFEKRYNTQNHQTNETSLSGKIVIVVIEILDNEFQSNLAALQARRLGAAQLYLVSSIIAANARVSISNLYNSVLTLQHSNLKQNIYQEERKHAFKTV